MHPCRALRCPERVEHERLLCLAHWRMLPPALRGDVWKAYEPARGINQSATWCETVGRVVSYLGQREGLPVEEIQKGVSYYVDMAVKTREHEARSAAR
jgi:hypothetical protein